MRSLLQEMWQKAVDPFIKAQKIDDIPPAPSLDSGLSFFPSLPKLRGRGNFEKDKEQKVRTETCTKKHTGHPSLLPGVFTMFCEHGNATCHVLLYKNNEQ